MKRDKETLHSIAHDLRKVLFKTLYKGKGGHYGASLSVIEILTALYFGEVMNYDCLNPQDPDRDRFILSKGHGAAALYVTLNKAGYFSETILSTYGKPDTELGTLLKRNVNLGIEATTGSLGHGFGFAGGIALAGKLNRKNYRVFTLIGDGECQEGSIWESALFASHNNLGNLIAIIDYNRLQAIDRLDKIIQMEPMAEKWKTFGWDVAEVDGHNISELIEVLGKPCDKEGKPRAVIAHTTKGKGIRFMENSAMWHNRIPNEKELGLALLELGIREEELMPDG